MFKDVYSKITIGNQRWNDLVAPKTLLYPSNRHSRSGEEARSTSNVQRCLFQDTIGNQRWDVKSTYIKSPPFLETMVLLPVCEL